MKGLARVRLFPFLKGFKLFILTLLLALPFAAVSGAQEIYSSPQKILLLHTLGPNDRGTGRTAEGISDVFAEKGLQPEVFIEYLDGGGIREFIVKKNLRDLLEAKFSSLPPDLIITTGNGASMFALIHSKNLFGGAPVVFCDLSNDRLISLFSGQGTGVSSPPPYDILLSEIERLHPRAPSIAFVSDSVSEGLKNVTMLMQSLAVLPNQPKLTLLVGLSPEAAAEGLKSLHDDAVIILDSPLLPRKEGESALKEMLAFIRQNTALPVYTLDEEGVKFGALGSLRGDEYEKGRRAGELAVRIMAGESPASIPPDHFEAHGLAFDYRSMKIHHIGKESLSSGSVVLNDPFALIKEHRPLFILLFIILFFLAALFATLVFFLRLSISKREKAEGELAARTKYWEELFQRYPEGVIVYDGRGNVLETNSVFRSTFALSEEDLNGTTLRDLLPWERGTLPFERFFPRSFQGGGEVEIPDRDGLLIPAYHLSFPLFEGKEELYCSLIQDISKRKMLEKQLDKEKLFQEALATIALRFVLSPSYRKAMQETLWDILILSRAKTCAIFTLDKKNDAFRLDFEVLSDAKSPSFSAIFPTEQEEDFFWKYFLFHRKSWGPIFLDLKNLPAGQKDDWSPLIERGFSRIFLLPLSVDDVLQGFLALGDHVSEEKNIRGETLLPFLSNSLAAALERTQGDIFLENSTIAIKERFTGIIMALCQVSELRDVTTAGHQKNVSVLAENLARRMNLPEDTALAVRYAGLVHDIGKLHIPPEILSRPSKLTPTEYALVKQHPEYGSNILSSLDFPWPLADIVIQHHERMDGKGYPRGLKGEEISVEGRIISVADAFDAMTAERPYRQKVSPAEALAEIVLMTGTAYDPDVVEALKAYCLETFQI